MAPTSTTTVEDFIRDQLAEELCCPAELITADARLAVLPGRDSIKLMKIVSEVERGFHVVLDDDQLYELDTVGDLTALINARIAG
jgi:acyl carrier protein